MAKTAAAPRTQPTARFTLTKSAGGYVTVDATTGLAWSHTLGQVANHAASKALIDALNAAAHGGHSDWRLPSYQELSTIAVKGSTPNTVAIADAKAFPAGSADWYWSSTPSPGIPDASRGIHFGRISAAWQLNKFPGHVRAVRGTLKTA
jgi:hypothetical protein